MTWTGQRLRQARVAHGFRSQQALADHIGAAVRSVASWEREEAKPQAHWAQKLDELFAQTSDATVGQVPLDPNVIQEALRQAHFLELLAEVARRHAHALRQDPDYTATTNRHDEPEHYEWFMKDAPTARRARGSNGNDQHESDAQQL